MTTSQKAAPKKEERANLSDIKDDIAKEETKETKGIWNNMIDQTRKLTRKINESVINQTEKTEKWQMDMASWPLKKIAKVERLESVAVDYDEVQTKSIKLGYDLVRQVIKSMDQMTEEILEKAEKHLVTTKA